MIRTELSKNHNTVLRWWHALGPGEVQLILVTVTWLCSDSFSLLNFVSVK